MGEFFAKKKDFLFRCSKCSRKFLGIGCCLVGFFATTSFAQDEVASAVDQPVVAEDVAKVVKEDPRADRAKERLERKDAKKAEIAEHKAEKKAIMADRDAAKAERKANRTKDM